MKNDAAELFAHNLKRLMSENQLNARSLAVKLAITESVVSRWKSAKSAPALDSINLVATYFNVPISQLFLNPDDDVPIDPESAYRALGRALGYRIKKPS